MISGEIHLNARTTSHSTRCFWFDFLWRLLVQSFFPCHCFYTRQSPCFVLRIHPHPCETFDGLFLHWGPFLEVSQSKIHAYKAVFLKLGGWKVHSQSCICLPLSTIAMGGWFFLSTMDSSLPQKNVLPLGFQCSFKTRWRFRWHRRPSMTPSHLGFPDPSPVPVRASPMPRDS